MDASRLFMLSIYVMFCYKYVAHCIVFCFDHQLVPFFFDENFDNRVIVK